MIRVSTNEVSFASVQSWKDIYSPSSGQPTFSKSDFYETFGSGFQSHCIGSERDPVIHSRMKRSMQGAFSTKALKEQEDIIQECVDKFIDAVGSRAVRCSGLDMTEWFEMIAFDILGEMAFGESFGSVDKGTSLKP